MRKAFLFIAVALCLGSALEVSAAVRICRSGGVDVMADNTGVAPVSAQFQKCVDDALVAVINLEPGTYLVDAPIVVKRPLTIRTAGLASETRNCQQLPAGSCARLLAAATNDTCINNSYYCYGKPASTNGMLQAHNTNRVVFDHLIFDGNRQNRQNTESKRNCELGYNRYGFNARMAECGGTSSTERCEFTYNDTRNALCGTGLEFAGHYGRIQGNAAYNNGVHSKGLWADGLTIVHNNNGIINDNHAVNNTDIGLIVGGARNSQIQSNWIQQNGVYAFAAMMLGNFAEAGGTAQSGDYTNATIRYNTIQCYSFWCGFGLNMGPDPWVADDRANIYGGTVSQNNISGARVLINFGGAGTSTNRTTVTNNTLSGAPTTSVPLKPGSPCYTAPNVQQNLPNNNSYGMCGNFANADAIPTSSICFYACWP